MNPVFASLLKQKKPKVRDPNLPPPPTLLGQVKELKQTREEQQRQELELTLLRQRLEQVEIKNRSLERHLRDLENFILNRVK